MKAFLFAVVTGLSLATLASTVVGTNQFPGYGAVSSDHVCLNDNSVEADVPASTSYICTHYSQGLNGETCTAQRTVSKPAQHLEAPLSFETKGCLSSRTEFGTSLTPHQVCVKYGTVTYHQPRAYSVVTVEKEDVFHDRLITTKHQIPSCK